MGVAGEISIGGAGSSARGYHNRPELIPEEKFINNPFSKEEGSRLYRDGVTWASGCQMVPSNTWEE